MKQSIFKTIALTVCVMSLFAFLSIDSVAAATTALTPNTCPAGQTYVTSYSKCIAYTYGSSSTHDARYDGLIHENATVQSKVFFTVGATNYAVYYALDLADVGRLVVASRPVTGGIVTRNEINTMVYYLLTFNATNNKVFGVEANGNTFQVNYLNATESFIGKFSVGPGAVEQTGTLTQAPNGVIYLAPSDYGDGNVLYKLTEAGDASTVTVSQSKGTFYSFVVDSNSNVYMAIVTELAVELGGNATVQLIKIDATDAITVYPTTYSHPYIDSVSIAKITNAKFHIKFNEAQTWGAAYYVIADTSTMKEYEYTSILTQPNSDIVHSKMTTDGILYFVSTTYNPELDQAEYQYGKINENGEYTILHSDPVGEMKYIRISIDTNNDIIYSSTSSNDGITRLYSVDYNFPPTIPTTLKNVYFTFWTIKYGNYVTPTKMRLGDNISLKNYDPKKIKLLAISLYDYTTKGNQCYSRTWKNSTQIYIKTCALLPKGRKYAYIFTFKDVSTGTIVKKYFTFNTIRAGVVTK
jgi:hypothetical protein